MTSFKSEKQIKFGYIKSIIIGLVIPLGYLFYWYAWYPATINEFLLLTRETQIANGVITNAEEIEDYVDLYEGRKTVKTLDFNFEYSFSLPNGKSVTSFGSEAGPLPGFLSNVPNKPFPIKVEYLSGSPKTNRIMATWTGEKTLLQWFRHKVVIGLIGFIFCCYLGYSIFKSGKKSYKVEISGYNTWLQDYYSKQKSSR